MYQGKLTGQKMIDPPWALVNSSRPFCEQDKKTGLTKRPCCSQGFVSASEIPQWLPRHALGKKIVHVSENISQAHGEGSSVVRYHLLFHASSKSP